MKELNEIKNLEIILDDAFEFVLKTKDKYDLIGNSHNYLLNYDWKMKQRKEARNIPQSVVDVQGANTCL